MKKIIVMLLALAMLVALPACNDDEDIDDGDTTTAATEAESTTETTTVEDETDDKKPDNNGGGSGIEFPENFAWTDEHLYMYKPDGTPLNKDLDFKDMMLFGEKKAAVKFTIDTGFATMISLRCPSYNDSEGSIKLELYEWVDDTTVEGSDLQKIIASYKKTVKAKPFKEEVYENFADNEEIGLFFDVDTDPVIPNEGHTYLLVVSCPDETDLGVGVYGADISDIIKGLPEDDPYYDPNGTRGPKVDDTSMFEHNHCISNVKTFVTDGVTGDVSLKRTWFMNCIVEVTYDADVHNFETDAENGEV